MQRKIPRESKTTISEINTIQKKRAQGFSFDYAGQRFASIDIKHIQASVDFNPSLQKAKVHLSAEFRANDSGYPYFDFDALPESVILRKAHSSQIIRSLELRTLSDPSGLDRFQTLNIPLVGGSTYFLDFVYNLPRVQFHNGEGLRFFSGMGDLGSEVTYLEKYFMANILSDQFSFRLSINIEGAQKNHTLFSNGTFQEGVAFEAQSGKSASWVLDFPAWHNSTSMFVVLSDAEFRTIQSSFTSQTGDIKNPTREVPVYLFSEKKHKGDFLDKSMEIALKNLKRFDHDLGPYAHESFVGYIQPESDCMEYSGAVESSPECLDHEILHSWFARGVLHGNDGGWLDEAIARWFDRREPQATELIERPLVQLSGYSQLYRQTKDESYTEGSQFLSEVNYLLNGKLLNSLSKLYKKLKKTPISTDIFLKFLASEIESSKKKDFSDLVNEYVYGLSCEWIQSSVIARTDRLTSFGDDTLELQPTQNDINCFADELYLKTWNPSSEKGGTIDVVPGSVPLKLHYNPPKNFSGLDSFQYELNTGHIGRVQIRVKPYQASLAEAPFPIQAGVRMKYYQLSNILDGIMPNFLTLNFFKESLTPHFQIETTSDEILESGLKDYVGISYEGYFKAPEKSIYTFYLRSMGGSKLYLNNSLLIDNDELHDSLEKQSKVALEKGYHSLKVEFAEFEGAAELKVDFSSLNSERRSLDQQDVFIETP